MPGAPDPHWGWNSAQLAAFVDLTDEFELIDLEGADNSIPTVNLTDLNDNDGLDGEDWIRELSPGTVHAVGLDLAPGHSLVNSILVSGTWLTPGMDVELSDQCFMRIKRIVKNRGSGQHFLEGIYMTRVTDERMQNQLRKWVNELCIVQNVDTHRRHDDYRSVAASEFIAVRQITFTNTRFPTHSLYAPGYAGVQYGSKAARREYGALVCRWKWTSYFGRKDKVTEESMVQLTEQECDAGKRMSDVRLLAIWLGRDDNAGKGKKNRQAEQQSLEPEVICLSDNTPDLEIVHGFSAPPAFPELSFQQPDRRVSTNNGFASRITSFFKPVKQPGMSHRVRRPPASRSATYSFGDICAGAGGMSRGADCAGLKIKFLLDKWDDACKTLRLNWPPSCVIMEDIFDFITKLPNSDRFHVDVLHISFPCQPHSPAHTVAGKDDDRNIAAGYSVIPLLKKCRPRIVTLEQTSGILTHGGRLHFNALIHQITEMGYSVRFKIANCAEYGNVHARMRAFILASAPGQKLPDFPAPTHGPGLKPLVTIRDRLRCMPARVDAHMKSYTPKNCEPYDANTPLREAITCSGGFGNLHPHGHRTFNNQELALLADFPAHHLFAYAKKTSLRKQIGNAVPVCAAKAIYGEVIRALEYTDREIAQWEPEVITLD